jgi:hypothetical protein
VKACAKIDEYLDFHHTSTRMCAEWLMNKNLFKELGLPLTKDIDLARKEALRALEHIDGGRR